MGEPFITAIKCPAMGEPCDQFGIDACVAGCVKEQRVMTIDTERTLQERLRDPMVDSCTFTLVAIGNGRQGLVDPLRLEAADKLDTLEARVKEVEAAMKVCVQSLDTAGRTLWHRRPSDGVLTCQHFKTVYDTCEICGRTGTLSKETPDGN